MIKIETNIKKESTTVEIEGKSHELCAEFSILVHELKNEGLTVDELKEAFKIGLMEEKEAFKYMYNELAGKVLKTFEKALKELAEESEDDEEE